MRNKTVYRRMEELYKQITHHAKLYFVDQKQEISNYEYDELESQWNELAADHPDIATLFEFHGKPVPIHDPVGEVLDIVKFDVPMLSLSKAINLAAAQAFMKRFPEGTKFYFSIKIDGMALKLVYHLRKLVSIITRNSGMVGEDVTHSLPLFRDIPLSLPENQDIPDVYEVNGEGFITFPDYFAYNEFATVPKTDPRNAVSGWIRALAENQDKKVLNTLNFAAYGSGIEFGCENYSGLMEKMRKIGFSCPQEAHLIDIEENNRSEYVPTDGIVIMIDSLAMHKKLGATSRYPLYGIAYKYPPVECFPTVEDIEWNTTRTGRVVPVALFTPTKFGNVTCGRASLDNYRNFLALELRKNTVVSVTRNNDVIPRLNSVIKMGKGKPFEAPVACPSCDSVLSVVVGRESSELVCNNNSTCPAQLTLRCVNMADKFGLDIDGAGPTLIAELVDRGHIKIPSDLLSLSHFGLIPERTRLNIEAAYRQPLWRVIKAAGLPDVGVVLAKRLANALAPDIIEEQLLDFRFLKKVKGISSITAARIISSFNDPSFEENFRTLLESIEIDYTLLPDNQTRICLTGSLGQPRDELFDYFAEHGIEATDKLSKDCKFVVVGEKPSSSKLLKANELGIALVHANQYASVDKIITFIKGS